MENDILFNRKDRVRLKRYRDIVCDGQLTDIGPEDIGEVVADCWGGYVKVDYPCLPVLMEFHVSEIELVEKYDRKTAFLRDLHDCLKKHGAYFNAYHSEEDRLVVELHWATDYLIIGPQDDIYINEEWINKELKGD